MSLKGSNGELNLNFDEDRRTSLPLSVRFDDTIYVERESDQRPDKSDSSSTNRPRDNVDSPYLRHFTDCKRRRKSGILKRRENTITTADAPPIILSDEGLKAGRVSPLINLPLFLTMTIRSIGIVFGDM